MSSREFTAKGEVLHNDHTVDLHPPMVKLLEEGETFQPTEVTVPGHLQLPPDILCVICQAIPYFLPLGRMTHSMTAAEFVWHVRTK